MRGAPDRVVVDPGAGARAALGSSRAIEGGAELGAAWREVGAQWHP